MRRVNLSARPTKCVIGTKDVEFVRHRLRPSKVHVLNDNLLKVLKASRRPTTTKEVCSFLGVTGY